MNTKTTKTGPPDTRVTLGKYFQMDPEIFNGVPRTAREDWVAQIKATGTYVLTHRQHQFLIGRGY